MRLDPADGGSNLRSSIYEGKPPARLLFSVCPVAEPRVGVKDEGTYLVQGKYWVDFNSQLTPSWALVLPIHREGTGDMQQSCWDLCSVFSLWKLLEPHEVCAVILLLQLKHPVLRGVEPPS